MEDKLSKNNDAIVILANPIVYLLMDNIIRKWRDSATFIGQMHSSAEFVLDSQGLYSVYPFIIKHFYPKLDKILFLTPEDSKIIQDAYAIDANLKWAQLVILSLIIFIKTCSWSILIIGLFHLLDD